MSRFVGAVVLSLATMAPSLAMAQSAALPAEFPPPDYEGNQYVDSEGCAFIRAGISGVVNWVPRMSAQREPLCGFQPTFASAPAPEPAPTPTPTPTPIIADAPAPRPAPARTPSSVGPPIETVASVSTPPAIGGAAATPAPAPAEPEVRTITLAEACEGRTGVQPRFIDAQTGAPVDCGPAAPPAASPAPAVDDGILRLSLSEICARSAADGTRFVDARTGDPVVCPVAPTVVAGPALPPAPAAPSAPAAPRIAPPAAPVIASAGSAACGSPYLAGANRPDVRCGPQAQSPSGVTSALIAPPRSVARAPAGVAVAAGIPASNPVAAPLPSGPAAGYEPVWDDGRLNPQRGLTAAAVAPRATEVARISTRTAPPPSAHRYVQVGTYGDPANAARAASRLRSLGLPVGLADITRNGQALRVVAAGPFADAASLRAALNAARGAGYSDAFTRR